MVHTEEDTETTIQIRELLRSDWFSSGSLLLLDNEVPYSQKSPVGGESIRDTEKITLQNSARLALVLVREFQKYCCDDSGEGGRDFESICLDDLFVTLAESNGGCFQQDEAYDSFVEKSVQNQVFSNEVKPEKPRLITPLSEKEILDIDLRAGFFSSFDDKGNDVYEELFAKTLSVVNEKPKFADVDQSKDADGIEFGMGYFSAISNIPNRTEHQQNSKKSGAKIQTNQTENSAKNSRSKILLGLDIISPESIETSQRRFNPDLNTTEAIQLLGCLIYSVFSKGSDPPPHFIPTYHAAHIPTHYDPKNDLSDNVGGRKSKSPRPEESKILFQLLDSKAYTVSISHLLSNMIDIGPEGKALHPFKSFKEIIQDLEEMISQPHLFLHDEPNKFLGSMPNPPVFGRQYYGRTKELTQLLEVHTRLEAIKAPGSPQQQRVESVFVSGRAGSGKSHLVNKCGDFLSTQGWIVVREKFDRGNEHKSQSVVCSLFDKIVKTLADMKVNGNDRDTEYSLRARKALTKAIDYTSLCSLAEYLPSIPVLIEDVGIKRSSFIEANLSHWKLVFLLRQFLNALLKNGCSIMLILDDLQWADSLALDLVLGELLESVGDQRNANQFIFAGLYRDNEVSHRHPLYAHLLCLRQSKSVNVSEMCLSAFSKVDISEMISAELRLPTRVVDELGDVVHKKTSGHILFAVELLNSMVRDSTISFSLKTRQYGWRWDKICSLKTEGNVASFIVSTLSTLQPEIRYVLRILSCFGFHIDLAILDHLDAFYFGLSRGIRSSLQYLVDIGVIDIAGGLVSFAHDLIQQHVYEEFDSKQRQDLHFKIGVFLGAKAAGFSSNIDSFTQMEFLETGVNQIYISEGESEGGEVMTERSLLSIATDHINRAGPEFITDMSQKKLFAAWNLEVGVEFTSHSNFGCALHYFEEGIRFIGKDVWLDKSPNNGQKICLDLYEGAAAASCATKKYDMVEYYTDTIFRNVSLKNALPAWIIRISALESCGKYNQVVQEGVNLFRRLKFDVPSSPPSPMAIMESMNSTAQMASDFSLDQIVKSRKNRPDEHKRNVLRLYSSMIIATYAVSSTYFPLLTLEMVQYSLVNNVFTDEAAVAFAGFGFFEMLMNQDYDRGKFWAYNALEMLDLSRPKSATVRVLWILHGHILIWFIPPKQAIKKLFSTYQLGMKIGDFTLSMYSLGVATRFALFEGENLALVCRLLEENLKKMLKYNIDTAKLVILDILIINELRGGGENPFSVFQGQMNCEDDLMKDALAKNNAFMLECLYFRRFYSAFWRGDYDEADIWTTNIVSLPISKRPKLISIFFVLFRGLIAFHQYRRSRSEEKLRNGIEAICKIEFWSKYASNFENKLLLLNAEQSASLPNIEQAKVQYAASIKSARDNGRVHEQGLAYELMGNFLSSVANEPAEALKCWKNAHTCYTQWGALGKATTLCRKHGLDDTSDADPGRNSLKHARDGL